MQLSLVASLMHLPENQSLIEVFHLLAVTGGGDAKAMAGGVSRSTIPAMAGLSVAITGTFASTFLKNKSKREEELLSEHLISG